MRLFSKFFSGTTVLLSCWVLLALSPVASASEEICAEVKIEILQELTIERQAFEAEMRINNQLDTVPLDNVSIQVDFADENGLPVESSFFITVSEMTGISDITGNGSIAPSSVAEIRWLIIPVPSAAQGQAFGKLYYVGAQLSYTYGGKSQTINVTPDTIVVKPQPQLQLDYFLTKDVVGDNPFTPQIEPAVPYTLGVRVRNSGEGLAQNVNINSAQPRIVENDQGLAIGFNILGML